MEISYQLIGAGLLVGFLVGLTGMGGGALLTPILVLVFKVPPLAAVSSDLVTSLIMKPFGGAVHLRKRTVHLALFGWLAVGSVPFAFLGSVIIGRLGHGPHAEAVQSTLKLVIAVALVASVIATVVRLFIERRQRGREPEPLVIKPGRTIAIGAIGGLAVGLTSVGAGTLIIGMLLVAYPQLRPQQLVGTDIVQAIPLVASAALGHLLFGAVQLSVTASLLIGAIPAVILGARLSSSAPAAVVRPITVGILSGSALALLHAPTALLFGGALVAAALVSVPTLLDRRAAGGPGSPDDARVPVAVGE